MLGECVYVSIVNHGGLSVPLGWLYIQDGKEQLCVAGIPMLEAMQVRTIHYVINGQMYRLGSNF